MDRALYERVVLAVTAVNEAGTPAEARHAAQAFLEEFKEQTPHATEYSFYIMAHPAPEHSDAVRHFALHVVEQTLRRRWKHMDAAQRLALRQAIGQLLVQARPIGEEAPFIKEKVAMLLADLVEREFPQRWETFVDELLQAAALGPAQAELALKTLTCVAEDCTNAEFNARVDAERRSDILRGLNALMSGQILPWLYQLMAAADQRGAAEDEGLLRAGLVLLRHLVPWVPHDKLVGTSQNFLEVLMGLLPQAAMSNAALDGLHALSTVELEPGILGPVLAGLPNACATLFEGLEHGANSLLAGDLRFGHILATTVAGFGVQNTGRLTEYVDDPSRAPHLEVYLGFSVFLLEMPSARMAGGLLPLFSALVREPKLRSFPGFVPLVPRILAGVCARCVRTWVCDEALSSIAEEEFSDGDEASAFVHVLRSQVNALVETIGGTHSTASAEFAAQQLGELITHHGGPDGRLSTMALAAGLGEMVRDAGGLAAATNPDALFWDACTGRMEHVFGGMTERQLEQPTVALAARQALQGLFLWSPEDPQFCRARLDALASFRRPLKTAPDLLWDGLERIFQYITYGAPGGPGAAHGAAAQENGATNGVDVTARGREMVARCAVEVRKKADLVLIAVCNGASAQLVARLPQICDRVQQLLGSGWLVDAQSTHLLEVCCVISRAMNDPQMRASFLGGLLRSSLETLKHEDYVTALASPQQLWAAMGVNAVPELQGDRAFIADRSRWYNGLFTALNDVLSVARRAVLASPTAVIVEKSLVAMAAGEASRTPVVFAPTTNEFTALQPFTPLWTEVLPSVTALLGAVQGSWAPANRDGLLGHEAAAQVLAMAAPEAVLKSSATNNITAPRPSSRRGLDADEAAPHSHRNFYASSLWSTPTSLVELWPVWMSEMRNTAYQILGQAFEGQAIFFLPGAFGPALDAALRDLEHQENRNCNVLLRHVVEPLLLCCPPTLYDSHLRPVLDRVVPHFLLRSVSAWSPAPSRRRPRTSEELYRAGVLSCAAELSADAHDLLTDKLKREVTRSWLDVILTALGLRGPLVVIVGRSNKTRRPPPNSALTVADSAEEAAASPQRQHAALLQRVVLFGAPRVTESILLFLLGALAWPDSTGVRRTLQALSCVVGLAAEDPRFYEILGRDVFAAAVGLLVASPTYLYGLEWEVLALARDIYLTLVTGRDPAELGHGEVSAERWQMKSDLPRHVMLGLPGVQPKHVERMEEKLLRCFNSKGQKDAIRSVLQRVTDAEDAPPNGNPLLGRAGSANIQDLPERLVLRTQRIQAPEAALGDTAVGRFLGLDQ